METDCSTDALRALAPRWSLAGDDKLLNILQNTHMNIVTKCQEVNTKLEQMNAELDDASIDLQNVNNKFLALSNSQFVESRVYDDDADVSADISHVKETPQKHQPQELDLEALKKSLMVLQNHHETVTILKDSDTETDSDGEDGDRVVLKPKDVYSDRPLPYIIGSQAWKDSWHAGLLPEESDSESGSEGREPQSPQYSDSEPEDTQVVSKANATISESSSDVASEQGTLLPTPKPTPADVAADLARRLAANVPKMVEPDSEYLPPKTISKTVYKPQHPQTGTIFTDEPPPLDSQTESSEEDDIFAELHKPKERVVGNLFVGRVFDAGKAAPQPRTEHRPLFEDDADEFDDEPVKRVEDEKTASTKKPVGGISVFGTNKGAESIGAAILKRNQRKSVSEEETDSEDHKPPPKSKPVDQTDSIKKEKDIFDDLFAKSATLEKKKQTEKDKVVKDKVDLFGDNLFDDVGDIFTTNVMKNKSNQKSIFDDDDDLFADIATPVTNTVAKSTEIKSNNKSIFDSDDELFADKPTVIAKSSKKTYINETNRNVKSDLISHNNKIDKIKTVINSETPTKDKVDNDSKSRDYKSNVKPTAIPKSIFDSDSDSDIFSNLVKNKDTESKQENKVSFEVKNKVVTEDIFKNISDNNKNVSKVSDEIKKLRSPSLFDDDDDNELFADMSKDTNIRPKNVPHTSILRESTITTTEIPINEKAKNSESIPVLPGIDTVQKVFGIATEPECEKTVVSVSDDNNVFNIKESNISDKPHSNDVQENLERNNSDDIFPSVPDNKDGHIYESKESEQEDLVSEIREASVQRNQNITHNKIEYLLEKDKSNLHDEDHLNKQVPIMNDFIETDTLFQKQKDLISKNIFVDEPPIFEKPKEPKRSKNVNALFDDDSEDEALFFRKSDMDDKSENFQAAVQSDRIFGIFHDEPPSIDAFDKDEHIGIFSSVISERSKSRDQVQDIFKEDSKIDGFQHVLSVQAMNISENKGDPIISKTENKSKGEDNNDLDDLFKSDKSVPETMKSSSKHINVHDILREIKEEEFDDIFKAANKVNNTGNDDLFKLTVGDLSGNADKNYNKSEKVPENKFKETYLFSPLKESEKAVETIKSEVECDSDEELFRIMPKPETPKVPQDELSDEIDKGALIKEDKIVNIAKLDDNALFKTVDTVVGKEESENVQSRNDIIEDLDQKPELRKKETNHSINNDVKKNSRIKSLNLNIDVSTLLPGASPKKQKIETPKEDSMSDTTSEEITKRITPENDSKLAKSISFEREPNSDVLDNKLSKERARIQVKRRPSTRRARREAVRKSAIDIDDSTDNSSSIDDPPKNLKSENTSKIDLKTVTNESSSNIINHKDSTIENNEINTKIAPEIPKSKAVIDNRTTEKPRVTSKVVYILNDEDIFNTKPIVKENELFKKDPIIPTLGSMYGETTKSVNPDNEIDKKSSKVSIFDSDSDEELFGGKNKTKKKVEIKGSLFGDDADDNLFGVKIKKTDSSPKPQASKTVSKEIEKTTEPIFSDPLSMLDDE